MRVHNTATIQTCILVNKTTVKWKNSCKWHVLGLELYIQCLGTATQQSARQLSLSKPQPHLSFQAVDHHNGAMILTG